MSNIESLAVVPERPSISVYGANFLWLFESFTRESYYAKFGEQAPAFDPERPVSTWFDTDNTVNTKDYSIFGDGGLDGTFERYAIPFEMRNRPNLPGLYLYPKLTFDPTDAVQHSPDGREEPIAPSRLTTYIEADILRNEIGGTRISLEQFPLFPYVYPIDENRRIHIIHYTINGENYTVAAWMLRGLRSTRDVKHPGHWDLSDPTNIRWIVEEQPQPTSDHPILGVPCRALFEDEEVFKSFGSVWRFRRVAVSSPVFTAEERDTIQANAEIVKGLVDNVTTIDQTVAALIDDQSALEKRVSDIEEAL